MKKKIVIHDNINKKETEVEVTVRDQDHLIAQQKFPARTIKPKKGKGSFSRNKIKKVAKNCLQNN